jgi:hypothetical protein
LSAGLQAGAKAMGVERGQGPPREGPTLLQGRVVCGVCGSPMPIRYRARRGGQLLPDYVCPGRGHAYAEPVCQSVLGAEIDAAVGQLLVDTVTPVALEMALAVLDEIQARLDDADRLRHRQVERAQYEADRARYRYMQVDPANRLVADSLEADWNSRLRALAEAQAEYQRQRAADRVTADPEQRERILALATDFPAIWHDPGIPQRERKRMVALLIEDVTLVKHRQVTAQVRFRGGATTSLTVPRPPDRLGAARRQRGNAPAPERAPGRVHGCPSRRGPQRARAAHRCRGRPSIQRAYSGSDSRRDSRASRSVFSPPACSPEPRSPPSSASVERPSAAGVARAPHGPDLQREG